MINLESYQKQAVEELSTGSILVGGVGTGKTLTSLAYYILKVCSGSCREGVYRVKNKIPLYVITTAQKRDKHEWDLDASKLSDDLVVGDNFVIDSWNNIKKYEDVKNAFFIFDEQRLVGYGTWVKAFLKIAKSNDWILLTATPGDQWTDYIPVFIANGFYKNKSQFAAKHIVYKPFMNYPCIQKYLYEGELRKLRDKISVRMIGHKETIRDHTVCYCSFNKQLYFDTLKNMYDYVKDEMIENEPQLRMTLRKIVNTDPSRIDMVKELLTMHKTAIVFYNFNYELEILKEIADEMHIAYSEWNGHKHEPILEGDRWVYLVQYNSGSEGWNCITTDTIIFYSLNYSYRTMEQACGRIDRMNTPYTILHYEYLIAKKSIDEAIERCIRKKENFNEDNYISKLSKTVTYES